MRRGRKKVLRFRGPLTTEQSLAAEMLLCTAAVAVVVFVAVAVGLV